MSKVKEKLLHDTEVFSREPPPVRSQPPVIEEVRDVSGSSDDDGDELVLNSNGEKVMKRYLNL